MLAEHLGSPSEYTKIIKKEESQNLQTRMWMIFSGPEGEQSFAEAIWETLKNAYFHILQEQNPYDRFEESLKILNTQITEDQIVVHPDFIRTHSIVLVLFAEGELHISTVGTFEVYLARKGKLNIISENISPQKIQPDVFINIASGELSHGDTLLFSESRILRHMTESELTEILHMNIQEGKNTLTDTLERAGDNVSFVLASFEGKETPLPLETNKERGKKGFTTTSSTSFLQNFSWDQSRKNMTKFFWRLRAGDHKPFLGLLLGILGLILILSFVTSFADRTNNDERDEYKQLLGQIQASLKNVKDQEILGEKDRANANLSRIDRDLEKILQSSFFRSEALVLLEEVSQVKDQINDITRISTPKELANLKTRKSDVSLVGVFEYEGEWFSFDKNTLFRIVLNDEFVDTIPLISESELINGVPLTNKKQFIFTDAKGKIFEYDAEQKELSLAKTEDSIWKKGEDIFAYSKYVYLLSPEENQIWKYERKEENYGTAIPYIAEEIDISSAISFAIDGEVFVFTAEGELMKFLKGVSQEYSLIGTPDGILENVTQIYTDDELEHILLLNPSESTVYVYFKGNNQATYQSQIVLENVGTLQAMWANAPTTLVIADENKVYEIDF